jgi:hypothetical protein
MYGCDEKGAKRVHHFKTTVPVHLHINGKQVPPIETAGEITDLSLTGLKIRCDKKIPIPSHGIIRFSMEDSGENLEMEVKFVQRTEKSRGFFVWRTATEYDMEVSLLDQSDDKKKRYQEHIHHLIFGDHKPVFSVLETSETSDVF